MLTSCLKTTIPGVGGGVVGGLESKTKLQPSSVWLELELSLAKILSNTKRSFKFVVPVSLNIF